MKPVNIGGHSAYQDRVLTQLRKYYPNAASLSSSIWQIIDKFWNLNLSQVDELMKDRYSVFGPEPRLPSDMLRAILVSAAFKITSYTRFAADLKETPLHAIISGFFVGDTPGVGTFMTSTGGSGYLPTRTCDCLENGIRDCKCNRIYHQPDCDIGWDSFMS